MFAVAAAGLLPATIAQAQWYGSPYAQPAPLYPYAGPYAVEVAPNTYVIHRPALGRARRSVRCRTCGTRADVPARGRHAKRAVINNTRIVRDPPIVIETQRVVDDPPRVIERRYVAEDAQVHGQPGPAAGDERDTGKRTGRANAKQRVIHADAEITIIEPNRMIIRLVRKPRNSKSKE